MKMVGIYLAVINLAAFFLYYMDKKKAVRGEWRISENTLFFVTAIGGSAGAFLGMYLLRHKTRKFKFSIGVPFLMILHIGILALLYWKR